MRKPGTILLLAVILGALVSAWVYSRLRQQERAIEAARRAAAGETIELVVANAPIAIGSRIDASQVRMARWPADVEPEGALRRLDAVVGNVVRTTVEKNQPLLRSQLVPEGSGLLPLLITEGMRAMSVKVDGVTGVSGFITPNSRVDVLVSGRPDGTENREQRSKVILQNVRVLAIGKSVEQRDERPVEVPTVTLLVSPADAEKLTLATRQEPVSLALRNYRDDDTVWTAGISTRQLFGDSHATAGVGRTDRTAPSGYSVEVLLGDKSTRQAVF